MFKKFIFSIFTLLIISGCNGQAQQKYRDSALIADLGNNNPIYSSVFYKTALVCSTNIEGVTFHNNIYSFKVKGPKASIGRGAIVREGKAILTAAHNLKGKFKVFVLSEGQFVEIEVIPEVINEENDYALLAIKSNIPLHHFEINNGTSPNDKLLVFGVSGWKGSTLYKLEINKYATLLYHSAYLIKGDSGGPLCDYKGRLVGINIIRKGFSGKAVAVMPSRILKSELN